MKPLSVGLKCHATSTPRNVVSESFSVARGQYNNCLTWEIKPFRRFRQLLRKLPLAESIRFFTLLFNRLFDATSSGIFSSQPTGMARVHSALLYQGGAT